MLWDDYVVSVIKEELRSRIHILMLRMEAEKEEYKVHTSLVEILKMLRRKIQVVKDSLLPEVYEVFTKQWGYFIGTYSQTGEHIEDLDKYFDQYLSIFMKYPHQIMKEYSIEERLGNS